MIYQKVRIFLSVEGWSFSLHFQDDEGYNVTISGSGYQTNLEAFTHAANRLQKELEACYPHIPDRKVVHERIHARDVLKVKSIHKIDYYPYYEDVEAKIESIQPLIILAILYRAIILIKHYPTVPYTLKQPIHARGNHKPMWKREK